MNPQPMGAPPVMGGPTPPHLQASKQGGANGSLLPANKPRAPHEIAAMQKAEEQKAPPSDDFSYDAGSAMGVTPLMSKPGEY